MNVESSERPFEYRYQSKPGVIPYERIHNGMLMLLMDEEQFQFFSENPRAIRQEADGIEYPVYSHGNLDMRDGIVKLWSMPRDAVNDGADRRIACHNVIPTHYIEIDGIDGFFLKEKSGTYVHLEPIIMEDDERKKIEESDRQRRRIRQKIYALIVAVSATIGAAYGVREVRETTRHQQEMTDIIDAHRDLQRKKMRAFEELAYALEVEREEGELTASKLLQESRKELHDIAMQQIRLRQEEAELLSERVGSPLASDAQRERYEWLKDAGYDRDESNAKERHIITMQAKSQKRDLTIDLLENHEFSDDDTLIFRASFLRDVDDDAENQVLWNMNDAVLDIAEELFPDAQWRFDSYHLVNGEDDLRLTYEVTIVKSDRER